MSEWDGTPANFTLEGRLGGSSKCYAASEVALLAGRCIFIELPFNLMNRLAPVCRILFSSSGPFDTYFESMALRQNRGRLFAPPGGARAPYLRDEPDAAQRMARTIVGGEFHFDATSDRFEDIVSLKGIATDDVPQPGPAQGVANGQL